MELRQGITGFRYVSDHPLPVCDLTTFCTHCYNAARLVGGRVLRSGRHSPGVEASFAMAILELPDGLVAVLLNRHYPVVCFAIPPNAGDTGPLRFVDCDVLADVFKASGEYEVLSRVELERAVSQNELQQLLPAEIEQAKYWRPHRIGDIVFNFWD